MGALIAPFLCIRNQIDGNIVGKIKLPKKISPIVPNAKIIKPLDRMLNLLIGYMKFLFLKTIGHHVMGISSRHATILVDMTSSWNQTKRFTKRWRPRRRDGLALFVSDA